MDEINANIESAVLYSMYSICILGRSRTHRHTRGGVSREVVVVQGSDLTLPRDRGLQERDGKIYLKVPGESLLMPWSPNRREEVAAKCQPEEDFGFCPVPNRPLLKHFFMSTTWQEVFVYLFCFEINSFY